MDAMLVQMSVSASLIIAAALCIRALALCSLPKRVFLLLWGIAAVRLLLPFRVRKLWQGKRQAFQPCGGRPGSKPLKWRPMQNIMELRHPPRNGYGFLARYPARHFSLRRISGAENGLLPPCRWSRKWRPYNQFRCAARCKYGKQIGRRPP